MKKLLKKLTCLSIALASCFAISAPVNAIADETQPLIKYDIPYIDEATEMPILGYVGVHGVGSGSPAAPSFLTRANVQTYMDAGFNILSGLYERVNLHDSEVRRALKICEQLELAYFVNDTTYFSDFRSAPATILSKADVISLMTDNFQNRDFYFRSPAFAGIAVKDEPSIHCFDQMGNVNAALNELTNSKKLMYTNLYPAYADQGQFGFKAEEDHTPSTWEQYVEYVDLYLTKVNPSFLSYDSYAVTLPNSKVIDVNEYDASTKTYKPGVYIKSLSLMRNRAKQFNIPFWVTVASHDHISSWGAIPIKQTQWTVNTSLAYGAKGIQYYTYWSDAARSQDPAYWADPVQAQSRAKGLVSANGAPTDNYYRIQKINNQIKLVDEILIGAEHMGVMQFGNQYIELIAQDELFSFGSLREISGDVFVGCFKHGDNDVYYIVNNSLDSGIKTFKADFVDKVNVRLTGISLITEDNPSGRISKENTDVVAFNLTGGEAVLLEVIK